VFANAPAQLSSLTLLEVLNIGGGGIFNLGRQSVAALLNVCSSEVNYNARYEGNISLLIADVNAAFTNGSAGSLATTLDGFNNAGCPLGGTRSTSSGAAGQHTMTIHPNPFSQQAVAEFTFSNQERYTLVLLDMNGRVVNRVAEGVAEAGKSYSFRIAGSELSEGVYTLRLLSENSSESKRLVLHK